MDRSGGRGRGGTCFAAVLEDYEEGRGAVAVGSAASQSSSDGGDGGGRPHRGHGGGRSRRRPVAVFLVVLMAASWHLDLTSLSEMFT